ncbi:MAG TPA: MoxR family ATPase [Vulgatibacter sp.]|nr:MoxR family ATPase [Vulgatibacter sp.]
MPPPEARALGARVIANVEQALFGKRDSIHMALVGLAARGHLLVEDLPGVGKSTLALGLARSLDLPFARIQFTSDLLPSDILGLSTWDAKEAAFTFRPGPIFHSVILADELNRTPPRTQSALLEAMAEGQVTLDGRTLPLPRPFFVVATLNPQEQHGTYPLPESQLDRFLMRLELGHPDAHTERRLLMSRRGFEPVSELSPVAGAMELMRLQAGAAQVRLDPLVADHVLAIAGATRDPERFALGLSPRGSLALVAAAKACALLDGRDFVSPSDVKRVAAAVLVHRLRLAGRDAFEPHRRETEAEVEELLDRVPAPE